MTYKKEDAAKVHAFPSSFKMLVSDKCYLRFCKIPGRAAVGENLWCLDKKWSLATWTPILYTRLNYFPNGSSFVNFPHISLVNFTCQHKSNLAASLHRAHLGRKGFYSICHSGSICAEKNGQFDRNLDNYPAKWPMVIYQVLFVSICLYIEFYITVLYGTYQNG